MSELKAYTYDDMLDGVADVDIEYYPKLEADKVIANKDKEIAELKDKIQQKDFFWEGCGFSKMGFKNTIAVANYVEELKKEKEYVIEQTAEVINGQEKELRHHKYKRCFLMVQYYTREVRSTKNYMSRCGGGYDSYVNARIKRLEKRLVKWSELMRKFKEAK